MGGLATDNEVEVVIAAVRTDFEKLRGRLFELVEATGMSERQAEAFIRLTRREVYDAQSRIEQRLRGKETHAGNSSNQS